MNEREAAVALQKAQLENEAKLKVAEIEAATQLRLKAMEKSNDSVEYADDGTAHPAALVQQVIDQSNSQMAQLMAQYQQTMEQSNAQQTAALAALIQQITKPKSVVRDANGKIVGVQ